MSNKIVLIRCQEHDYPYHQWHEDINISYCASVLEKIGIRVVIVDHALSQLSDDRLYKNALRFDILHCSVTADLLSPFPVLELDPSVLHLCWELSAFIGIFLSLTFIHDISAWQYLHVGMLFDNRVIDKKIVIQ